MTSSLLYYNLLFDIHTCHLFKCCLFPYVQSNLSFRSSFAHYTYTQTAATFTIRPSLLTGGLTYRFDKPGVAFCCSFLVRHKVLLTVPFLTLRSAKNLGVR